ncbi:Histidine kinase-, DNA gyrase B-, and HSP90-like ATPase [Candidatus Electrothrix marina]|uniref:histidine kinase n=3 Tax=Candidatus Electrothrix marina TaxID=1859130 RepID=A0A444JDT4_9BACT|nr:Histidine kinase-, DNA gyrase B-, and HSP90-like ATPase [Candidatus Electrothrix marina]
MFKIGLRNRFLLYFLPLLLGVLIQGGWCVWTFSTVHNHFTQLQQEATTNASAMLDLKKLLLSLDTGIREQKLDRDLIREKANQLGIMIETHAKHKHKSLTQEEQAAHKMLHHVIFATTLSQYLLEKSEKGWPTNEEDLAKISEAIKEELSHLENAIDKHLHLHLLQIDRTEVFIGQQYRHTLAVVALTGVAVILLTLIVVFLMMRSVLEPMKILQEGTRQIGMGNLSHQVHINSGDEFEFLAGEFGKMAEQLAGYHNEFDLKVQERTEELLHANAELRKAEEQVHNLSQKLLTVQETERQQISLYLHDNVAQNLSSLKITGESLLQDAAKGNLPGDEERADWAKLLNHCIKTVRELSYNLRPPGLEQIGLASAIADHCRDFEKKTGLSVQFTKAGVDSLDFPFDDAINIYRLVQEGLNNIEKHALATAIAIRLIASHPNIILRIEDNGCGFDPEQGVRKALENKRFGLLGMEERVRMMQGAFKILSAPQQGTKIIIEFPGPVTQEPEDITAT